MTHLIFSDALTENIFLRLLFASLLGALIGLERDIHGRAAGLRTNLLVSLGAAVFMVLSITVARQFPVGSVDTWFRADPTRIAAQIITGIGFLGAGAIVKSGFSIRGLTSAAGLWVVAGIGMAAGAGYFELAIFITAISLVSLILLNRLEKLYAKDSYRSLEIVTPLGVDTSKILEVVKRKDLKVIFLDFERNYQQNWVRLKMIIRLYHKGVTDKLSHQIVEDLESCGHPINEIKWWHQ